MSTNVVASRETFPLLAELLAEQQRLDTPVARFAAGHAAARVVAPQLIPLTAPGPGEHYAFEVDLEACSGCKSCVAACHALNGLDDTETWRDVGLLVSPDRASPFTQTVTTACHHCADPACLNGCPVLAYEKNPRTGVVVHLDDQCIGCSYCVLKCPYDVPKYSPRLGIVRKCDLCHGRLAAGEAPACAQSCPTHAIKIITVPRPSASQPAVPPPAFLPGAPDPAYTRPTTRYVSQRALPARLVAADASALRVQPAHAPLAVMLTLLSAATGLAVAAAVPPAGPDDSVTYYVALSAWLTGAAGLAAGGLHLGRPERAWRVFLGWRRSWLSREALVFGAWFALAGASVIAPAWRPVSALAAVAGLFCSAMIYIDTRRRFWRAGPTFGRFFGTALVAGLAVSAPPAAAAALALKLGGEAWGLRGGGTAARLQRGPLRLPMLLRATLALTGCAMLAAYPGWWQWPVLLAGELCERLVFFRAVDAPKMPGQPV